MCTSANTCTIMCHKFINPRIPNHPTVLCSLKGSLMPSLLRSEWNLENRFTGGDPDGWMQLCSSAVTLVESCWRLGRCGCLWERCPGSCECWQAMRQSTLLLKDMSRWCMRIAQRQWQVYSYYIFPTEKAWWICWWIWSKSFHVFFPYSFVVSRRLMHEANLSCHLKGDQSSWVHFIFALLGYKLFFDRSFNFNQQRLHLKVFFLLSRLGRFLKTFWGLDLAFTSYQKRAIKTLNLALEELDALWIPVTKSWKLNERMCASCWSWIRGVLSSW